jgi:glycerol uptake facilitator-like aquaporin
LWQHGLHLHSFLPHLLPLANPAVTFARAWTDNISGIAPKSVIGFIAAQLLGAAHRRFVCRAI